MSNYEEEEERWIQWFCSLPGNDYFCQVPHSYIEDSFNLYGLRAIIPRYQDALRFILDKTGKCNITVRYGYVMIITSVRGSIW